MPHELGHHVAIDGEVLAEHGRFEGRCSGQCKAENTKRKDVAMQVRQCA
jgi:hypothetical protein